MSDSGQAPLPPFEPAAHDSAASPAPLPAPAAAIPADLDTPWDILDLVVFFFFSLGMLYLLSLALEAIAVVRFGVPPSQIERFGATNAGFVVFRQVVWFGCILLYLCAVIRRRTREHFWRAIGWRGLPLSTLPAAAGVLLFLAGGAALAIGADFASMFYNTEKHLPIQDLFASPNGVLYLMAFGILVAPLAEETVFRGYVYPVLARKFGMLAGVAFTGILFGLVHVPQLRGGWGQIATLTCVGMALTAVRAAARSVYASYLVHLGYNTFLFSGFFIDPGVLRHLGS